MIIRVKESGGLRDGRTVFYAQQMTLGMAGAEVAGISSLPRIHQATSEN